MTRIQGLETEYALFFYPDTDSNTPDSRLLSQTLLRTIRDRVPAVDAYHPKTGITLANGGMISIEVNPLSAEYHIGLIETSTPETTSADDTVRYQQAMQAILEKAAEETTDKMRLRGYAGRVVIAKNSVDSGGRTYGSHENYYVSLSTNRLRRITAAILFAAGCAVLWPVWVLHFLLGLFRLGMESFLLILLDRIGSRLKTDWKSRFMNNTTWERIWMFGLDIPLNLPHIAWTYALYRLLAFPDQRRYLTAFLVTRGIWAGSGWAGTDGGEFRLTQKSHTIGRISSLFWLNPNKKPIYDFKAFYYKPTRLFSAAGRLHIISGDNNMNQFVERLKLDTTGLIIDMIQAGRTDGLPELIDPVAAMKTLSTDTAFRKRYPCIIRKSRAHTHATLSAFDIQRAYLTAARAFCRTLPDEGGDKKRRVLKEWSRILVMLERDPDTLRDQLDWVAKKSLLDAVSDPAVRKIIDLKYHDIHPGEGYHRWLADDGLQRNEIDSDTIQHAIATPPPDTRAQYRGRLVSWLVHTHSGPALVGWEMAMIPSGAFGIKRIVYPDPENPTPHPDPEKEFLPKKTADPHIMPD